MLNNVNLMGARGVLELPGGQLNPERGGGLSDAEGVDAHEEMNEGR